MIVSLAEDRDLRIIECDDGEIYASALRPNAERFLEWSGTVFDEVNMCTAGLAYFQTKITDAFGITDYFDNIYGRRDIAEASYGSLTPAGMHPVLVDDLPVGSMGWVGKMQAILSSDKDMDDIDVICENHYIKAKCYFGGFADKELQKIKKRLKEFLR